MIHIFLETDFETDFSSMKRPLMSYLHQNSEASSSGLHFTDILSKLIFNLKTLT